MNIILRDPTKCDALTTIFQYIKLFTDNVNIAIKKDKFEIQTMDSSHISILELSIPSSWFEVFTISQPVVIGVHSSILFKILSTREKYQTIEFKYDIGDTDKLFIQFKNDENIKLDKVFDKNFEIPLVDLDYEALSVPEIDYQAEFTLPSGHFTALINQLKIFGDSLEINCTEEQIMLFSHSTTFGKMSVDIKIDDLNSFSIVEGETLRIAYSLNHIYNMVQFYKLAPNVEISIKTDYPLKLVYPISGSPDAKLVMYLAPQITIEDT
jgi:proliferating cell nuclear antigen